MELRAAGAEEWAAIAAVHHEAATEAYAGIFEPYADLFADEPLSFAEELRQQWQRLLADPAVVARVAVIDEEIVGVGALRPDASVPSGVLLTKLYVQPARQGSGAGAALLGRLTEAAAASGWASVNLWVLEANARARGFYERRGWHLVPGRTIENPPTPILDVLYQRSL